MIDDGNFSYNVLLFCQLAQSHTLESYWDTWTEGKFLATPALVLLRQNICSEKAVRFICVENVKCVLSSVIVNQKTIQNYMLPHQVMLSVFLVQVMQIANATLIL